MKTKNLTLVLFLVIALVSCNQKPQAPSSQPQAAVQPTDSTRMILARVFIKPGSEETFITAAKSIVESSNNEEGCISYELFQSPYERSTFIFVEFYKNKAAIDFHFSTSYFKEFGEKIGAITTRPAEIKIFSASETKQ